ncbi:MAG: hypothetical protein AB7J35_16910 [Dehalococcoidia bacterium]
MQTDELSIGGDGHESWLCAELERASQRAKEWDYDPPSDAAVQRARTLFAALDEVEFQHALEISIGVDGSIDIFASRRDVRVSVEILPSGSIQFVRSHSGGSVEPVRSAVSDAEVVHELSRAA